MYTLVYVQELRKKCRSQNLWAPAAFWTESLFKLHSYYNGIGAESWSPKFRKFTSKLLDRFSTSALIHDWEYSAPESKKNYKTFTAANIRFAINSAGEAWHMDDNMPRKLRILLLGLILAILCQLFGWSAYRPSN